MPIETVDPFSNVPIEDEDEDRTWFERFWDTLFGSSSSSEEI